MFCKFDHAHRISVLNTPGVIDVVRFGNTITAVEPEQIAALQRVMGSGGVYEPWPHVAVGDRVKLEDGPLVGLEGIVLSVVEGLRLIVSVTLLRRSVAIEVRQEWVQLPDERRPPPLASAWKIESRSGQTSAAY